MTFAQFVGQFGSLINAIIATLGAVAVFIFLLGLMRYMFKISSGESRAGNQSRDLMLWGILSLFILFAFGGILNFFANDFFGKTVNNGGTVPSFPDTTSNAVTTSDCTYDAGSGQYTCNGVTPSGGVQADDPNGGVDFSGGGVAPDNGLYPGQAIQTQDCVSVGNGEYVCSGFFGGNTEQSKQCTVESGQYVCNGFSNDCALDGLLVRDGTSAVFYATKTPPNTQQCSNLAQTRTCSNGTLSGSTQYRYASCLNTP